MQTVLRVEGHTKCKLEYCLLWDSRLTSNVILVFLGIKSQ